MTQRNRIVMLQAIQTATFPDHIAQLLLVVVPVQHQITVTAPHMEVLSKQTALALPAVVTLITT
jgi:hypothetical protein